MLRPVHLLVGHLCQDSDWSQGPAWQAQGQGELRCAGEHNAISVASFTAEIWGLTKVCRGHSIENSHRDHLHWTLNDK